jgi:glycosyltransferase involved in cell wall biosynthesis
MVAQHVDLKLEAEPIYGEPRIVVVIPAYNEERCVGSMVLKSLMVADHVIVVDDGSTDATAQVAEAAGALVLQHDENQGKGVALNTGFAAARQIAADVIVTLDGDGQHRPEELPDLVAPVLASHADIVIGSRYLDPDGNNEVPRHRMWGHRVFNWLTNTLSGTQVTDSQTGYRAFSPRAAKAINFAANGFAVESEMQFLARQRELEVAEVAVNIDYVDKPKRPVAAHGLSVLNGILRLVGQYRPLLFFGVTGFVLLISGLLMGLFVVEIYSRTRQLAVGYTLITLLLAVVGSLSLYTGIILHSIRALLMEFTGRGVIQNRSREPDGKLVHRVP